MKTLIEKLIGNYKTAHKKTVANTEFHKQLTKEQINWLTTKLIDASREGHSKYTIEVHTLRNVSVFSSWLTADSKFELLRAISAWATFEGLTFNTNGITPNDINLGILAFRGWAQ